MIPILEWLTQLKNLKRSKKRLSQSACLNPCLIIQLAIKIKQMKKWVRLKKLNKARTQT
jgi:hypothetical protein